MLFKKYLQKQCNYGIITKQTKPKCGYSSSVECQLPKLNRWVRLPLSAPNFKAAQRAAFPLFMRFYGIFLVSALLKKQYIYSIKKNKISHEISHAVFIFNPCGIIIAFDNIFKMFSNLNIKLVGFFF